MCVFGRTETAVMFVARPKHTTHGLQVDYAQNTHAHTHAYSSTLDILTNPPSTVTTMQVFDAGEKLFIALVERDGCADDASEEGEEEDEGEDEEGGGETENLTAPFSRKVVVRDDYVQDGDDTDIFLVDREFSLHPYILPSQ